MIWKQLSAETGYQMITDLMAAPAALHATAGHVARQIGSPVARQINHSGAGNIFLGVNAFSAACVLGILGGPAIRAVLIIARLNHRLALDFLAIGALPFAIATWWSVVTPLTRHLPWWPPAAVSPSTLSQHP